MIVTLIQHWYLFVSIVATAVLLWMLETVSAQVPIAVAVVCYIGIVMTSYWVRYRQSTYRITVGVTLGMAMLGHIGLYLLFEQSFARYIFAVYLTLLIGAVVYIPTHFSARLAHEYKPWRRMFVSIMTVSLFSLVATLYGLEMFFQTTGTFLYSMLTSGLAGLTAYAIFRLYYPTHTVRMVVWSLVLGFVSLELFWVLAYLSFGYLVLAAAFIIVWYGMVVLVRFHISPKGIIWNKQIGFLLGVLLTLICIFLFAKWL